ncbi:hypothetical protein [Endozoicomonas sp. SCSIO W0465]|uniref:hypothetical protein n=1 Tax=Endozoicomonas sp. SCSIO W0465 TaxID=2918516 RepID=UPI00207552E0|nr:hypothetical protein [Endozoicomonas sp. SCSIO W0465]USE38294.1 hypothetical protein MJO57_09080 [Endozoicomonas sp. SCSIO W0465]
MGALTLPCSSIDDLLQQHSAALQQWFASGDRKIEGLVIRKFPSWLESEQFIKAGSGAQFDTARFRLMMSNQRDIWRVTIDMIFHPKARLLDDGSTAGPGILFNVLDDEDQGIPIDYFAASTPFSADSITPEQWCTYWFKKLAKSHHINRIFAYKEFEAEVD